MYQPPSFEAGEIFNNTRIDVSKGNANTLAIRMFNEYKDEEIRRVITAKLSYDVTYRHCAKINITILTDTLKKNIADLIRIQRLDSII